MRERREERKKKFLEFEFKKLTQALFSNQLLHALTQNKINFHNFYIERDLI
jgi:hypothetical protein